MKKALNNRGSGYFTPCFITLGIAMILSMVLFYANVMTIIQTTKSNTERVLDSFIMKNSIVIYNSVKQGHDFTASFDENFYISQTSSELSLDLASNSLYSYGEKGEIVYSMTNPQITYTCRQEFASELHALKLKAAYDLKIPVYFAGKYVGDITIPLTVRSEFTLKE